MTHSHGRRNAGLIALLLLVAGCGLGQGATPGFAYAAIGPEGGQVAAGDVALEFPEGALDSATAVTILPQAEAPEIDSGSEPCPVAYLGPIWCCGPVGLDLDPTARLRISYDPGLIPTGFTEDDLVLLLWDDEAQVLRPATQGVEHDAEGNAFVTADLAELGHVAVGVRTCTTDPDLFFLAEFPLAIEFALAPGTVPVPGLYLGRADDSVAPLLLPTADPLDDPAVFPDAFVPSLDRERVLWQCFPPGSESPVLRTLRIGDPTPVTVVGPTHPEVGYDPMFGWMRGAADFAYFHEYLPTPAARRLVEGTLFTGAVTSTVGGGGVPAAAPIHGYGQSLFPDDCRQSEDGSHFLVRLTDFEGPPRIDVILSDGTGVSSGLVPPGGGQHTPRFVPQSLAPDDDDVYGVSSDTQSVFRHAPDGTPKADLYAVPSGEFLQDFVLAPDGEHFAAIVRRTTVVSDVTVTADWIDVGTLSGGVSGSAPLGGLWSYGEVVFHPDGSRVFVDFAGTVRSFGVPDAAEGPILPIRGMYDLDVNRTDGRLLLVVRAFRSIGQGLAAGITPPGLYVADPDGSNAALVTTPIGLDVTGARWRSGFRAAPGMFFESRVR